jgi:dTDP-4-amino-4,6-dideoxy-D-galactose acyltransferase
MTLATSHSEPNIAEPRVVQLIASDWETAFFGSRMGAIVHAGGLSGSAPVERAAQLGRELRTLIERANREGYEHLIYRARAEDPAAAWAAEGAGMRLVDVAVDSSFSFVNLKAPSAPPASSVREGGPGDLSALRAITSGAFRHTRFSVDPFFTPEQVSAFYKQWATNLFAGLAQVVLVSEIDGNVAGFISCALKDDEGRIPLVAAHEAYLRRGVGSDLLGAALRWFEAHGARVAHVKTQAANYPALGLYHRTGFTISRTELTFSITLRSRSSVAN